MVQKFNHTRFKGNTHCIGYDRAVGYRGDSLLIPCISCTIFLCFNNYTVKPYNLLKPIYKIANEICEVCKNCFIMAFPIIHRHP